jgi:serine/threonine-protein kinase
MGKVFLANSPDGAEVALKTVIFPEGLNARARWETVERFQREARAARSLDHPNICQVLDIGADADTFFIVMEYLDGRSLREEIDSSGAIAVERSAAIMFGTSSQTTSWHCNPVRRSSWISGLPRSYTRVALRRPVP